MNDKDYVTFARRFVKATAENMDVKELRDFYIKLYKNLYVATK